MVSRNDAIQTKNVSSGTRTSSYGADDGAGGSSVDNIKDENEGEAEPGDVTKVSPKNNGASSTNSLCKPRGIKSNGGDISFKSDGCFTIRSRDPLNARTSSNDV